MNRLSKNVIIKIFGINLRFAPLKNSLVKVYFVIRIYFEKTRIFEAQQKELIYKLGGREDGREEQEEAYAQFIYSFESESAIQYNSVIKYS